MIYLDFSIAITVLFFVIRTGVLWANGLIK